ncbi:MAG: type II toxin-antitoxin system prevent-host-death family antitoxin [Myxococcota bacterium]|nr:type II toxin-antitoxin system prevent-host-death family antitoxin [Myxococcota bacterium]
METLRETEIGSFEAKTRLSELLREIEKGNAFVITRRGKKIARLVPVRENTPNEIDSLSASFREIRGRLDGKIEIKELVEAGRRW